MCLCVCVWGGGACDHACTPLLATPGSPAGLPCWVRVTTHVPPIASENAWTWVASGDQPLMTPGHGSFWAGACVKEALTRERAMGGAPDSLRRGIRVEASPPSIALIDPPSHIICSHSRRARGTPHCAPARVMLPSHIRTSSCAGACRLWTVASGLNSCPRMSYITFYVVRAQVLRILGCKPAPGGGTLGKPSPLTTSRNWLPGLVRGANNALRATFNLI